MQPFLPETFSSSQVLLALVAVIAAVTITPADHLYSQ
jgi:hypothetical protein